jgi:hypothetical protein
VSPTPMVLEHLPLKVLDQIKLRTATLALTMLNPSAGASVIPVYTALQGCVNGNAYSTRYEELKQVGASPSLEGYA